MSFTRTLIAGSVVSAFLVGFTALSTGLAYVKKIEPTLPSFEAITNWKPSIGTTIRAVDDTVLGVHSNEFREFVKLEDIPEMVINGFIAAEDGLYWEHNGVNPVAIARALLTNIKNKKSRPEGASTITQQVVKNILLTSERTLDRKIKEAILALKADKEFGKRRILEIYLNEIYLGEGAYGVSAAAKIYFDKTLQELTINEVAVIAALPKAPSVINPVKNMEMTTDRRNYVLSRMLKEEFITLQQKKRAQLQPIILKSSKKTEDVTQYAFKSPEEAVRRALVSSLGKNRVYSQGGDVRTTIDPQLQKIVHSELRAGLVREDRRSGWNGPIATNIDFPIDWEKQELNAPKGAEDWRVGVVRTSEENVTVETKDGTLQIDGKSLSWATNNNRADSILKQGDAVLVGDIGEGMEIVSIPNVEGAVVVLDPESGAIRAMEGGFSFETSQFNRAIQAKRQTGSIFKSFVYLAALEAGFNAMSPVLDRPIVIDQGETDWRPSSHSQGLGLITLRQALEKSRNEATVRLVYDLGLDYVAEVARRAGLKLSEKLNYAMSLGTAETSPLNVAEAYATLANGGHNIHATFVPSENEIDLSDKQPDFDPIAIAQISSILEGVTYAGTAKKSFQGFDLPISAKTGTTDKSKDAWFASYGPKFVLVVWVGKDNSRPLEKGATGGATAGSIARKILDNASESFQFKPFLLPEGSEAVIAKRQTGGLDQNGDVVEIIRTREKNYD